MIAFTGHNVVFADVDAGWVRSLLPAGDVAAPLTPLAFATPHTKGRA